MTPKIDNLSLSELHHLEYQVKLAIHNAKARVKTELRQTVQDLCRERGLSVDALFSTGRGYATRGPTKGTKVAPKYCDSTTGSMWTGRGRTPLWLQERLRAGNKLEDFRIQSNGSI